MGLPGIPKIPTPGDIVDTVVDGAEALVDAGEEVVDSIPTPGEVVDTVVEGAKALGGVALDVGEKLVEEVDEAISDLRDAFQDGWECLASNFENFTGTLFAVVDGAKLECNQASTRSELTATSSTSPTIGGRRTATVTDHKVGTNIFPFDGNCKKTGQRCAPEPVPRWVPAARGLGSRVPLLPSNGQILCGKGGVISIADPGQQGTNVTSEGVPLAPPGVDLEANIQEAAARRGDPDALLWFYRQVRKGGPWDYKQRGKQYEDFGNYHYGATGAALGIPPQVLRRMAGWAQKRADTSEPEYGEPTDSCGNSSFGDDPRDQEMIDAGHDHD
ncbi:PAAR-like protein [Nannocystis pusilla]|uniref:PAAR-like protein n=1 Tax=Nannocystis pusilla TaxID=889268 RepID=UPI003BF26EF1